MSLVNDFAHYYNGTWIAQKEGNLNLPLFITSVDQNGRFHSEDYSHEAEQALVFYADKWYKDSEGSLHRTQITINVFDPSLILESPDVGYVLHSRNIISWTHINPVRQRAKGLLGNKLRSAPGVIRNVSGEMVYNLFNPSFEGLVNRFIFINPQDFRVYYKGVYVGYVDVTSDRVNGRQSLRLLDKFKHISQDFGEYNVELVENV